MNRFLAHLVRKLIKTGDLTVTSADGTKLRLGDGTGSPVHLRFKTAEAERAVALDPNLKLGECYMDGDFELEDGSIYQFLELVFKNVRRHKSTPARWVKALEHLRRIPAHLLEWNTLRRSRSNVQHHYDLSGELYDLFLDPDRQYSCAYFEDPSVDLEHAQLAKKRLISSKLIMDREGLRVLDIGSGWGGMGLHLASQFNAKVTGVTLSDEQHAISTQRAREDGFAGQVEFRLLDYRKLHQSFDRIVSVGMFEHVGRRHYSTYFNKCAEMLDEDGVMLLHTIGQSEPPTPTNPFIKKHIFPGGYIPSLSEMLPPIERSGLVVTDIEVLRIHYAETLKAWRTNFLENWDKAKELYDERFCRMWEFYLAGSEIAFRWQDLVVFQIQLAHRPDAVPLTRDYIGRNEHAPHRAKKASESARKKRRAAAK
ncbi:cyclopropane-fatty-acyl-phospholipid synthase family protein [Hoeflea prorocentri]|uniref:cyclopropane-fatty-acyl-phospholipid synthase family protein n=1 Tax=Hoeflea prorocentri TaxID=1922333 RepID=UPI002FDD307E